MRLSYALLPLFNVLEGNKQISERKISLWRRWEEEAAPAICLLLITERERFQK